MKIIQRTAAEIKTPPIAPKQIGPSCPLAFEDLVAAVFLSTNEYVWLRSDEGEVDTAGASGQCGETGRCAS